MWPSMGLQEQLTADIGHGARMGPTAGPGMRKLLTAAEVAEVSRDPAEDFDESTDPAGVSRIARNAHMRGRPVGPRNELEEWVHQQQPERTAP